ncbi:MAG: hypothetical protein COC19_02970 [SAR86 cluster bacterium]|uniref:DUF6265 domain-containing protein n=1 Tax=SAR86 cluster bacterium TaxID=2030880 RepID=A0A2A4MS45_9GAMM|nr:MAG: hypothetical protein COC19_02970 [SAR86 cluster bacterium]
MIKKLTTAFLVCLLSTFAFASTAMAAGPAASIDQLAWMTGNWAGDLGPNQLEENWIAVEGGSLAAMVRMTGNGGTTMFEMITIEEVDGSLVLNIQQFSPGFKARTPNPQTMQLTSITANSVMFTAVSEGGMKSLGYSNPTPETFIIHVEQLTGDKMDLNLVSRSIWK